MSRERKNDRHVPLGPARRLVPRPSNASVSRRIRRGLQWFEKQNIEKRSFVCNRSHAFRARFYVFFAFLRMRSSLIPVRCRFPDCRRRRRRDRLLPRRLRTTGSRTPPLFASHRDVTQKRTSEMVRADPTTTSRRSPPAARGTVPASIAAASPPRRAIARRPARILPPTPTEPDRCPPPAPRPQEAIFPEALKSLKEADPDVYALVQKEKLRQMCVETPR